MVARPLIAILGPTATGKSRLGLALAERLGGEIVNCDSTAVYRRFDIGTDKVPKAEQRGIPHHLVDIVEPTACYSAADYARDSARVVADIRARDRWPILVGGTGFYYRALTRGLFPGPGRDPALRARLARVADRRGSECLHRWLQRVDPSSADRLHPRDTVRLVRALEVYLLTATPLSSHFAATRSPLGDTPVVPLALRLAPGILAERVASRVDDQFRRGIVDEVRTMLSDGLAETAHPFGGLVYRQVLEMLHGERDEAATRALIVRENCRYARRQLIWFRKEPTLRWLFTPGEDAETLDAALAILGEAGVIR